jgi:hypothetical protein
MNNPHITTAETMTDSLLEFPCEFPIKMMGRDDPEFREAALEVIERHAGPVLEEAVRESFSRRGRFLSITVTITATSQQQLDDIYRELSDHEQVLVAL